MTLTSGKHQDAVDALATVFDREAEARTLLDRVDFPRARRPRFAPHPQAFWIRVVREVADGLTAGGLPKLLAEAKRLRPGNDALRCLAIPEEQGDEIPPLLPYLPDRRLQEDELTGLVQCRTARRPLLCLVHGGGQQSHDTFLEKLEDRILPRLLGLPVKPYRLEWPPSCQDADQLRQGLCRGLAREVLDRDDATRGEVQTFLADIPGAVLIHTHLLTEDWDRHGDVVLDGFAEFWDGWPELGPSQHLFAVLFLKYQDKSDLGFWKRRRFGKLNYEIRRAMTARDFALSELESVRRTDAEHWARSHEAQRFRRSQELVHEIGKLFRHWERRTRQDTIPMDVLAPELKKILRSQEAWT